MPNTKHLSILVDEKTATEADKHRDKGAKGHVQETDTSLYNRLIKHALAHAKCKEGGLND